LDKVELSEKYRVEVEKRIYFSSGDASVLVSIPDVAVVTGRATEPVMPSSTATLPAQP